MSGGDKKVLDKILLFDIDSHLSLSATMLTPVKADGISLDIPRMRDRHHHILFGDEVFDPNFWSGLHNFRFPFVPKGISNGEEFLLDRIENQSFTCKEGLQAIDQLDGLFILVHNFALFKVG